MNDRLQETVEKGRKLVSSAGFDYAEIRLSAGEGTSISLSGRNVDTISSGESDAGSARVLKNGSWGFVTFNDLSSLERYFNSAAISAGMVTPAERVAVTPRNPVTAEFFTAVTKDFRIVPVDEKFELL